MKHHLLLVLLCLGLSLPALAQSDAPATRQDIQRYLDAVHSQKMIQQMVDAMSKPMHQMIHDEFIKDQDKLPPDFEAKMNQQMDEMLKDAPWDKILDAMIPVYQKHFTQGDVNALIAFYSSPTGQKILNDMPAILSDSMQSVMPIMRQHIDTVTRRMQDEIAESLKQMQVAPQRSTTRN
jgi:hypothetical protein